MTLAYVFNGLVTYVFWWEKHKDIVTASFVNLPGMTSLQWDKFESLAMENTYDVSDPDQKQNDSIAWYVVPRDCRDDEVGVMEFHERDTEETISTPETRSQKAGHTVNEIEEDVNVITEWDTNLYMTRY
ncbi:Ff.00g051010.m01.CDS01 [Fusarium sp. VM40]|nr:Ff.00g051010.m01.CDS01 [Fusarium sp. VM40]